MSFRAAVGVFQLMPGQMWFGIDAGVGFGALLAVGVVGAVVGSARRQGAP